MLEDEEHLALSELKKGKYSKKIHIVRLVTKVKKSKRSDRIDQIDTLTFGDEQAKLIDYVSHNDNWYAFCLHNERMGRGKSLRVTTVKLGPRQMEDDEESFAFKFVSECLGSFNLLCDKAKPTWFQVVRKEDSFFLYVGIGAQVVVFKRELSELQKDGTLTPRRVKSEADDILQQIDEEVRVETQEYEAQMEQNIKKAMDEHESKLEDTSLTDPSIVNSQKKLK